MIRPYQPLDCPKLARLFYETVHIVNAADYTSAQLDAWAPGWVDEAAWNDSFLQHTTLVAEKDGVILGFGDMDKTGYLDRLYVHHAHQHEGIATMICNALEQAVAAPYYTTHASITAKPFFEQRGYHVEAKQTVVRHGVDLVNFVMKKQILQQLHSPY